MLHTIDLSPTRRLAIYYRYTTLPFSTILGTICNVGKNQEMAKAHYFNVLPVILRQNAV